MNQYVSSWQLNGKSLPEKFLGFSDAYLDSAERLCKVLVRSTRKASYQRGAVVLYLTFHSVELFLKATVLHKCPQEKLNHNIEYYEKRHEYLYPGNKYKLTVPFKTKYCGHEPPEIENNKYRPSPQDQVHRYPSDKDGQEWAGIFAFYPTSFLNDIQTLKADFQRVRDEIFNLRK